MSDPLQENLFDSAPDWAKEWDGMPEFQHDDLEPWASIQVHFANREDMASFSTLVGQTITPKTQSVWFPKAEIGRYANKRYSDES